MTELISNYLGYMEYTVVLMIGELLFLVSCKRKEHFWLRAAAVIVATHIYCMLFVGRVLRPISGILFQSHLGVILYYFVTFFFTTAAFSALFQCRYSDVLFSCVAGYLADDITYNAQKLIEAIMGWKYNFDYLFFVRVIIYIALYAAIYWIFAKGWTYEVLSSNRKATVLLSSAILAISIIVGIFVRFYNTDQTISWVLHLLRLLCCLMALMVQFGTLNNAHKQYEMETMKEIWAEKGRQYAMSKDILDSLNARIHDMKHLLVSSATADEKTIQKKMLHEIENYETATIQTENPVVDSILFTKGLMCNKKGILLSAMVDGKAIEFMESEDVCILLGNLIDNMIEAVEKCSDAEKKNIGMSILRQQGVLHIHTENYVEQEPDFQNGLPLTTKTDKLYHGFGVKSIDNIVKKYKGTLQIEVDANIFQADILIPTTEVCTCN